MKQDHLQKLKKTQHLCESEAIIIVIIITLKRQISQAVYFQLTKMFLSFIQGYIF